MNAPTNQTPLAANVTLRSNGTVMWKDTPIEHFGLNTMSAELMAAQATTLSQRCAHLEAIGMAVTSRAAISVDCYTAPAGSPWLKVLPRYYTFMRRGEHTIGLFFQDSADCPVQPIVVVSSTVGSFPKAFLEGPYSTFHHFQNEGFVALDTHGYSYHQVVELLASLSTSPETLENLIYP